MPYMTDLKWMSDLGEYSEIEQKVLLALSHDKYKWRSRDRLYQLTRISPRKLDRTLSDLLAEDLIRPAFSANRKIIYGLKERVG